MKNQGTPEVKGKNWNKMMERELGEGYSSTTGNGVAKPVWKNANRVNRANHFIPRPVQLNTIRQNVNSVRPNVNTGRTNVNSVKKNVNSIRHNVNSVRTNVNTCRSKQPVPTNNTNSFGPVRPQVNKFNQKSNFSKSHSPVRRPIVRNTARMTYSHAVKGNWSIAVKTSAGYNWRRTRPNSNYNSGSNFVRTDHPLKNMEDRGIFDSGCSRYMTGNKDHLDDFKECKGGSVTFGGSKGYITGKGRIRVGTLPTPNANASEEEDTAEELIVVPTAVKHIASKVGPRMSSTNSKAEEFLIELQNLKTQEKEAYSTGISEDTPEILAFRKELDELAQKHLREVPKNKATSTNSVNSGSGQDNTQPADQDDSDMPELTIFNKPQKRIFDEASYDDEGAHALEEPKKISKALKNDSWVEAMQEELLQFRLQHGWYVADMLKKFNLASVKTTITLIETKIALTKDEEADEVDVHLYRSMIGLLPKIHNLNASEEESLRPKGKPNLGLWYPIESSFDLEAYSDNDYAGANLDRKSITGGCQFLRSRFNFMSMQETNIVATLYNRSRICSCSTSCGQVLWIQNQMMDYGFNFMNTKIHIDNESTICVVKNPVYHSRTKHIEIRHHFIRDCYEKRLIDVLKIHTDSNVADLLTKGFDVTRISMDLRMDRSNPGKYNSSMVNSGSLQVNSGSLLVNSVDLRLILMTVGAVHMANLKYSDKHNMVAFLKKPNESVGFTEVVDFLKGTSLMYALTHNPTIYDSLVKQFWQTATVRTHANGTQQLVASIDSNEYTITESSVRSKLQLADATGIHNLSDAEIYAGLATLRGYAGDIVPVLPAMLAGAAVDQGEGSAQPAEPHHTPIDPIPSTSQPPITSTIPSPHHPSLPPHSPFQSPPHSPLQSPLHSPHQSPPFSPPRINSLEKELKDIKQTLGNVVVKLVKKVKSLKKALKRKSKKVLISESEGEASKDQERKIQDIDDDPQGRLKKRISPKIWKAAKTLSKVASQSVSKAKSTDKGKRYRRRARSMAKKIDTGLDAKEEINTGREEINTSIDEVSTGSTKVDFGTASKRDQREGKAPMVEEDIQTTHKTKEQMRQEEAGLEEAIKLQAQLDEEVAKQIHLDKTIDKRMAVEEALSEQQKKRKAQLKKLKFEEIKEEFDKLVQQIDTFVPINLEATKAKLKRYGEELQTKRFKKQRFDDKDVPAIGEKVAEVKEEEPVKRTRKRKKQKARKGQRSIYQIIRANGADTVYMSFGAMVKDFTREDLIELYRLVMQKYGTNRPKDAYDRVLWSDLRTMFDPPLWSYGADTVYMSFGAMIKDFTREDLIELYRLVMQKYGTNRPEYAYDIVLWSDLRTMFDPPLIEDAIWSLPLQQKMVSWRYYDKCEVHCLTLEACTIYMLADRKYPLSKEACQVMLKMKLLDGK
ncbi:hypothetical protein Tco_1070096 [Tanacetum coccineum]|uniref:Retrovirus-related Pol polyprotein from transposon TNT 1-94-like beta-barrel domain-containing protein n=1 Tax=Tanacetum coccineum TaxID=301880 RepID=A0ABQ5HLT2_9ASTR